MYIFFLEFFETQKYDFLIYFKDEITGAHVHQISVPFAVTAPTKIGLRRTADVVRANPRFHGSNNYSTTVSNTTARGK
jgi:hypothetical protein